jgi:hypothetical protein
LHNPTISLVTALQGPYTRLKHYTPQCGSTDLLYVKQQAGWNTGITGRYLLLSIPFEMQRIVFAMYTSESPGLGHCLEKENIQGQRQCLMQKISLNDDY